MHTPDIDDMTPEDFDTYIGAEVDLPLYGEQRQGKVTARALDSTGKLFGKANSNPILDMRVYQVEFPYGNMAEYSVNVIAENLFSQCNASGNQFILMDTIVDHNMDGHTIKKANMYKQSPRGSCNQQCKRTTKGWHQCVQWKNGSTSWERLSNLKESYPIKVAKYVNVQGITDKPAFTWWVHHILKSRDHIVATVNKHYHKWTHKFGFEIPKTIK